jgi:hypothetical protein
LAVARLRTADGGVEEAVGRGEAEDLQLRADRLRRERGGHACHRVGDLTHVDQDEPSDHLAARTGQGGGDALDGRAARDCVVDQQHPPARCVRSSDRRFVDLVTAIPRLADEGEGQPCSQRCRRGQRHTGGLGADDDIDAEVLCESCTTGPGRPQM